MSIGIEYFQPSDMMDFTYTVKDICKILKVSERKAYELCSSEEHFKVFRVGKSVRIHKQSFDNWIMSQIETWRIMYGNDSGKE